VQKKSNWFVTCLLLLAAIALPREAAAQTRNPHLELFAGYAIMRPDAREFSPLLNNVMGWGFSATPNVYRSLGITIDAGGFYRKIDTSTSHTTASAYSLMAGPTLSFRHSKVTPYVHVLAGFGLLTGRETTAVDSDTFREHAFVGAAGGGLDIPVGGYVSIRVIEADYFPAVHKSGGTFNNIRWRSGVVFRIGRNR
jgi:hypothetical protein